MFDLTINGAKVLVTTPGDMPLLSVLGTSSA